MKMAQQKHSADDPQMLTLPCHFAWFEYPARTAIIPYSVEGGTGSHLISSHSTLSWTS